jgi:glycosyltransferase involved in cell wall biosynthesis
VEVLTTNKGVGKPFEMINGVEVHRFDLYTSLTLYRGDRQKYIQHFDSRKHHVDLIINVCTENAFTDLVIDRLSHCSAKKVLYFHGMAQFSLSKIPPLGAWNFIQFIKFNLRWRYYYWKIASKLDRYNGFIHLHDEDPTTLLTVNKPSQFNLVIENQINFQFDQSQHSQKDYLCISNYQFGKNQEFILEAYYKSDTKRSLTLVGGYKSKYYQRLRRIDNKLKKRYGAKKVQFIVNESRSITENRIKNCHAILNGSKSEKYPVCIVEAMANGKPYISTEVGIVPSLPGGMLVKNTQEMTKAINILEKNKAYYDKLSEEGKNYENSKPSMKSCVQTLIDKIA